MPSVTESRPDLQRDGPWVDVHFLVPEYLENELRTEGKPIPDPIKVRALIDTGASAGAIKENIPKELNLNPIGVEKINTPSCKGVECYRYFLRMAIPSHQIYYEGVFTAVPLDGQGIK